MAGDGASVARSRVSGRPCGGARCRRRRPGVRLGRRRLDTDQAAVGPRHGVGDHGGIDEDRPVHAVRGGVGRRRRQREPGIGRQRHLDGRGRERSPDPGGVAVLDMAAQQRRRLLLAGRVGLVEADQLPVHVAHPAEHRRHRGLRDLGLRRDVEPTQDEAHAVAEPAEAVGRHLHGGRRGRAAYPRDPDPVGAVLRQLDRVEAGDDVGAEIGGAVDLVEQLRRHCPDRHQPAGVWMLGDDARPVGGDLGEREPDPVEAGDLGEERVVAAGGLRPALEDVAGDDRAGQRVPVVASPAVMPGRRPADQRGVGRAPRHDDGRARRQAHPRCPSSPGTGRR